MNSRLRGIPLLILVTIGPRTSAQTRVGPVVARADVFYASRLEWRGISRGHRQSAYADGAVGLMFGGLSLTAGGWHNEILGRDGKRAAGQPGDETDLWVQSAISLDHTAMSLGLLRSDFRLPTTPAVTELYATLEIRAVRWSPKISVWTAVDGAGGTYVEPILPFHHLVNPLGGPAAFSWTTSFRGGFQIGDRQKIGQPSVPGPTGTGLTHLALASALQFGLGVGPVMLTTSASPQLIYGIDPATRAHGGLAGDSRFRFVLPFEAGISVPIRRPR